MFVGQRTLLGFDLSENRPERPFPKILSISYLERVSDFFNDNHGFRNALVFLGSKVMIGIGISSTHHSVIVGEDGWLFFTDDQSDRGRATMKDFRGRQGFTLDEIAAIRRNFEKIGHAFSRCGIPFVLWLIPNKQTIYGEHLIGFREARGGKRLDQFVDALHGIEGLQVVDARQSLLAAKTSIAGHDLYLRTDTHWNGLGAFVAYRSLMAELKQVLTLQKLEDADLANYDIRSSPFSGGDLAANMLNERWRFTDRSVDLLPRFTRLASKVSASSWTNPAVAKSIVIYGDSFSFGAVPYIQEHFGRGHLIIDYAVDGEVVGKLRPDVVIEEIVERHIGYLVAEPTNLDKLCGI